MPYLFDAHHWRVDPVRDLEVFHASLPDLVPPGSVIYLAGGCCAESGPLRSLHGRVLEAWESPPLPGDFDRAPPLSLDAACVAERIQLAGCHPAIEIAEHVAVCDAASFLLECFDLPYDPISVSLRVSQDRVSRFARACGVGYRRWRPIS